MEPIDFNCPIHKSHMKRNGDILNCKNKGCKIDIRISENIFDCIKDTVSNEWDNVYVKDKHDHFKHYFGYVKDFILTPVINNFILKHILENHQSGDRLLEMGCGEATTSIILQQHKDYNIVLIDNNDAALSILKSRLIKNNCFYKSTIVKADISKPLYF